LGYAIGYSSIGGLGNGLANVEKGKSFSKVLEKHIQIISPWAC
jgi:hypothetical protein